MYKMWLYVVSQFKVIKIAIFDQNLVIFGAEGPPCWGRGAPILNKLREPMCFV